MSIPRVRDKIIGVYMGQIFNLILRSDGSQSDTMNTLSVICTNFSYNVIEIGEYLLYSVKGDPFSERFTYMIIDISKFGIQ